MKVYLDVCCLNRPFDDQGQEHIRLEAEAVLLILARLEAGQWQWLSSEVVEDEIMQTPDPKRRERIHNTTDDQLVRQAAHFAKRLTILVDNPLNWLVTQKEMKS